MTQDRGLIRSAEESEPIRRPEENATREVVQSRLFQVPQPFPMTVCPVSCSGVLELTCVRNPSGRFDLDSHPKSYLWSPNCLGAYPFPYEFVMDLKDSDPSASPPAQSRNDTDKDVPSRTDQRILNASSATQKAQNLELLLAGPHQKDLVHVFRSPTAARSLSSDYPESGDINTVMAWCDKKLSESPTAAALRTRS